MNHNFDHIIDRRKSDSVKWNRYDEDVLPLWVADMDFPPPKPVIHALHDRLKHGIFGYSVPQESTKQAICGWLQRRHNWLVQPEQIVLFPGVVPAFNVVTRVFTNPGDSVVIQTPAYRPFFDLPVHSSIELIKNPLQIDQKGRYLLDHIHFKRYLQPNTRVFMLCNPHNPTGRVFTKTELTSIATVCLEQKMVICSDEIHSDLVYPPYQHTPIASLSEEISQATVTLISPSKTFNIAGLHTSAVIIQNENFRDKFIQGTCGYANSLNVLGEAAMCAAYTHGDPWLDDLIAYLDQNRIFLSDFIQDELSSVSMNLPEGTYLGWLDFSSSGLDSPGNFLLHEARIALNEGDWFGDEYSKFARINFGCPHSQLELALHRIKSALNSP
jgi:cystathionine beta-lyase